MKKLFKLATVTASLAFGAAANVQASDSIGFVDPQFLMQNHPLLLEANEKYAKFVKNNETKFANEDKALAAENKTISNKEKALISKRNKLESDAKALQKEQSSLEAQSKKKMAELDKNTRLSTKMKQEQFDKAMSGKIKAFQNKVAAIQKREADFTKEAAAFQKEAEAFQKKVNAFQSKLNKAQKEAGGYDPAEVQKKVVDDINATIKKVADERGYTLVFHPSAAIYAKDESKDITEAVLVAMGGKMPSAAKANKAAEKPAAKAEEKPAEKPAEAAKPATETPAAEKSEAENKPAEEKK